MVLSTLLCSPFSPRPRPPPLPFSPISPGLPSTRNHPKPPTIPPLLPTPAPNSGYPTAVASSPRTYNNPPCTGKHPPPQHSNAPKPQHFSKWNIKQIQNTIDTQHVINLYIENLPLQWSAVELHCILYKYGEVVDIYIPAKRSKNGKRFGFARFRACYDTQRLISFINLIKVGNGHLQSVITHDRSQARPPTQNPKLSSKPPPPLTLHSKTFAETVSDKVTPILKTKNALPDRASISFSPLPNETEWLSKCAFAVLSEPLETHIVLRLFLKHGHSVSVSELGGDSLLIHFPSSKAMTYFIGSNHEWSVNVFDLLRPWQKSDGPSNRKVWVRAKGVPLHAWSCGFFHSIVSRFGSLISTAPMTENKIRLDYAFSQVITTVFKPISWEISTLIDETSYQITIEEVTQPPMIHTPFTPSPSPHNSPNPCHPSPSKPFFNPQPPLGYTAAPHGGSAPNFGQLNSDPFNLMPIIDAVEQPQSCQACLKNLASPSRSATPVTLNPIPFPLLSLRTPPLGPQPPTPPYHSITLIPFPPHLNL
ncbi:hypothetical protein Tsubulata_039267 [Turnera subulata]|uniref:RRM domain-containing protein n=1 Tax=Turnera subulata TaxID=218843 RepID=A0A9Q0GEZ0_9ROSI|nr:hypothetical protein Tsubulata_039267 [Turnera subulata]